MIENEKAHEKPKTKFESGNENEVNSNFNNLYCKYKELRRLLNQ